MADYIQVIRPAIELAQIELMVCVDSDDYMPDQAVERSIISERKWIGINMQELLG